MTRSSRSIGRRPWVIPAIIAMLWLIADLVIQFVVPGLHAQLQQALGPDYRSWLYGLFGFFAVLAVSLAIQQYRKGINRRGTQIRRVASGRVKRRRR